MEGPLGTAAADDALVPHSAAAGCFGAKDGPAAAGAADAATTTTTTTTTTVTHAGAEPSAARSAPPSLTGRGGGPQAAMAALLASRPGFPRGLRVLLVDSDPRGCADARTQLEELGYSVTPAGSLSEATALLLRAEEASQYEEPQQQQGSQRYKEQQLLQQQQSHNSNNHNQQQQQSGQAPATPDSSEDSCSTAGPSASAAAGAPGASSSAPAAAAGPFDVVLADVRAEGDGLCSTAAGALVSALAAADVALVLMGSAASPDTVMAGIKLGAADFLARPLSGLKLKNLWQHTVRRAMARAGACMGCTRRKAIAVRHRPAAAADGAAAAPLAAAGAGLPPLPPAATPRRGAGKGAASLFGAGAGPFSPALGCGLAACFDDDEDLAADLTALFMGPAGLDGGDDLDTVADLVGAELAGAAAGGSSGSDAGLPAGEVAAAAVAALMMPGSPAHAAGGAARGGGGGGHLMTALRAGPMAQPGIPGGASPLSSSLVTASEMSCGTAVAHHNQQHHNQQHQQQPAAAWPPAPPLAAPCGPPPALGAPMGTPHHMLCSMPGMPGAGGAMCPPAPWMFPWACGMMPPAPPPAAWRPGRSGACPCRLS